MRSLSLDLKPSPQSTKSEVGFNRKLRQLELEVDTKRHWSHFVLAISLILAPIVLYYMHGTQRIVEILFWGSFVLLLNSLRFLW